MRAYIAVSDLLYLLHAAILRDIRKTHRNPLAAILSEVAQMIALLGGFFILSEVIKIGATPIRGDMLIYLMTGIFFYQVHTKTVGAVMRSEGQGSLIMHHLPLVPGVLIAAAALSSLYLQVMAAAVLLLAYHMFWAQLAVENIWGLIQAFILAWGFGIGVGLLVYAMKPHLPGISSIVTQVYNRANMLACGQMFVANTLPATWIVWFDWNPLFHLIDQARGHAFENYDPWFTSMGSAISTISIVISLGVLISGASRVPRI